MSRRHTYGNLSRLGDIGKDIRGVKMTPQGIYVDQKSLVFLGLNIKKSVCIYFISVYFFKIKFSS